MKQAQTIFLIAAVLMLASIVGDALLRLPDGVTMPLMAAAVLLMWYGIRLQKRAKQAGETAPNPMQPAKRFALLVSVYAFASVSGFFLLQHSQPQLTTTPHLAISIFTFLFCIALSYWLIFRRSDDCKSLPNDRNA